MTILHSATIALFALILVFELYLLTHIVWSDRKDIRKALSGRYTIAD